MPAAVLIPLIMQGIQGAIVLAPKMAEFVKSAKDFITALFTQNLITKAQQDALHAWVDNQAALVASGIRPPAWTVEPDPQ